MLAQRQRPGGRGYLSELPTLVTVQWLHLGSAEEEGAADGVVNVEGTDEQQKVGKAGEER